MIFATRSAQRHVAHRLFRPKIRINSGVTSECQRQLHAIAGSYSGSPSRCIAIGLEMFKCFPVLLITICAASAVVFEQESVL